MSMQTYEYACSACGHQWEQVQRIVEAPVEVCPKCAAKAAHRLISGGTNFILKGGGWYSDLYSSSKASSKNSDANGGGSSDTGSKAAAAGPASPETKSESKSEPKPSPAPAASSGSSSSGSGTGGTSSS